MFVFTTKCYFVGYHIFFFPKEKTLCHSVNFFQPERWTVDAKFKDIGIYFQHQVLFWGISRLFCKQKKKLSLLTSHSVRLFRPGPRACSSRQGNSWFKQGVRNASRLVRERTGEVDSLSPRRMHMGRLFLIRIPGIDEIQNKVMHTWVISVITLVDTLV